MTNTIVYVCGPYSNVDHIEVCNNISRARATAQCLWASGYAVICPHMNSAHLDGVISYSKFAKAYINIMLRCDAVFVIDGWESSFGSIEEIKAAKVAGIPIYYNLEDLKNAQI